MRKLVLALLLAATLSACGSSQPDEAAPESDATTSTEEATEAASALETHNMMVKLIDVVPFNGSINLDDVECAGYGDLAGQLVLKDAEGSIVALHTVDYAGVMGEDACVFNSLLQDVPLSDFYTAEWTTPSGDVFEQVVEGEPNRTSISITF